MALSQMGVPDYTSGRNSVYLRSADSGITEINAQAGTTGQKHLTVQLSISDRHYLGHLSATSGYCWNHNVLTNV
jgi:alpha-D-ribose 1-methylphosphonate 5-triphosphate synthase subunit PhnG